MAQITDLPEDWRASKYIFFNSLKHKGTSGNRKTEVIFRELYSAFFLSSISHSQSTLWGIAYLFVLCYILEFLYSISLSNSCSAHNRWESEYCWALKSLFTDHIQRMDKAYDSKSKAGHSQARIALPHQPVGLQWTIMVSVIQNYVKTGN